MITEREQAQINHANASGKKPIVFVHGLWLLPSSWDRWKAFFEEHDFIGLTPGWPDDPDTVAEAHANPEVFAHKMVQQVTDHYLEVISGLDSAPAVVGHSFGGLISMKIAGEGVANGTVAIDSAPFRGVLPLPIESLKAAAPVLSNIGNRNKAITLTFDQFKYGWANHVDDAEAAELYETFHVPASGAPLFQAATANLNPFTEAKADFRNPNRGPLLIISGVGDNTAPPAIQKAAFREQSRNPGITEFAELPNRGHALVIDHDWREVAQVSLDFLAKVPAAERVG